MQARSHRERPEGRGCRDGRPCRVCRLRPTRGPPKVNPRRVGLVTPVDIRSKLHAAAFRTEELAMSRAEKLWHLRPSDPAATNRLAAAARVSPVVAQLLLNRGISNPEAARRFLDSPLAGLHPPQALPGVEAA